jgi:hypothetical protein
LEEEVERARMADADFYENASDASDHHARLYFPAYEQQ